MPKHRTIGTCVIFLTLVTGCVSQMGKGPTTLPAARSDWVQLSSGEWLKGRIKSMQQWVLDFNSDKLNELSLNWEDVQKLHMPQGTILYGDNKVLAGSIDVDQDLVTLSGQNQLQIPRSELRSISPGGPRERDYWSGNIDLGVTERSGNTNQTEVTAQADSQRRTADSRLDFSYIGNYDLVSGAKTTENDRVGVSYDRLLTQHIFVRALDGQYYRDIPLNIAHQATISAGAGYFIVDRPRFEWDVYAGPAYQYTHFVDTSPGTSEETSTLGGVFQTRFDKKLTQQTEFIVDWQGILASREAGLFTQQLVGTLRFKITHLLHLDLSLTWHRTEQPKPDASGVTPKRDDFQTVMSLGVEF